jgi:hypothetical protein
MLHEKRAGNQMVSRFFHVSDYLLFLEELELFPELLAFLFELFELEPLPELFEP